MSERGIRLNLDAVAIVKVGGTEDAVRAAAQRFLGQQGEIEPFTREVLAGSLRSIVGTLTVDAIIRDRVAFAAKVAEESESSLNNQGLVLDTFQIQDVTDDSHYLRDLGRPEAAAAARNAAIAEANAQREASEAESRAATLVAEAQKELSLRQASFKAETDRANAEAEASGSLAKAERDQEVLAQQEHVAQRQSALTERQLDTQVRKPADARRYEAEQVAQGERNAAIFRSEAEKQAGIAAAQADAERVRLAAEADGARVERAATAEAVRVERAAEADARAAERSAQAELARRTAGAEATRLEGAAEAEAIRARGDAEGAARTALAAAFEQYGDAARAQLVVDVLPRVAEALAAPIASISDLTVISTDGAGALSRSVGANLRETLEVVKRTTGIDLTELLGSAGGRGDRAAVVPGPVGPPAVRTRGRGRGDAGQAVGQAGGPGDGTRGPPATAAEVHGRTGADGWTGRRCAGSQSGSAAR